MSNTNELSTVNTSFEDVISERPNLSFYPWHFVHFSLPYRKSSLNVWERNNGSMSMVMTAGTFKDHNGANINMLPYGKYARLALLYLCTESKRTGSTRIDLAKTLRGFMRDLGLSWNSKSARDAVTQLRALLSMQVMFTNEEQVSEDRTRLASCSFKIGTREDVVFETDGNIDDRVSYFLLSDDFYESVVANFSVPLEYKVWAELVKSSKSPIALDVYLWFNSRLHNSNEQSRIKWEQLQEQFGSSTANLRDFKSSFRKALDEVLDAAPQYKNRITEQGNGRGKTGFKGFLINPRKPQKELG